MADHVTPAYPRAIAVDFDGTLFETDYPTILAPKKEIIARAKAERSAGSVLILWTCRAGEDLEAAIKACAAEGLTFDFINENDPRRVRFWGNDCRKISADEYWDDLAVRVF